MSRLSANKELLKYELFSRQAGVTAFSTTRRGGCSEGKYASFNCSPYCGDDPASVCQNLQHLSTLLPVIPLDWVIPHQVHGTQVLSVGDDYINAPSVKRREMLEGVDALVTDRHGFCLCVSTADCIPLIFHDSCRNVVAVAHAGWRGTVGRIAGKTLDCMSRMYGSRPSDVSVAIGPGISLEAFEVGVEVYEAFREAGFPMEKVARWYRPSSRWHIDLWMANYWQLLEAGIPKEQIECSGVCTYLQCDDFFSARRLGIHSGRMLSGIMLLD